MNLQSQIELITDPQVFTRLCNAVLIMEHGDDYLPIDDDRPDKGNDGYLKSEKRMFAGHCFKRIQNRGLDEEVRKKVHSDLRKAVKLKEQKAWDIENWTFLSNYPIVESVAVAAVELGRQAQIDVSWRGPEYFATRLTKYHKSLLSEFPGLQVNKLSDQLEDVLVRIEALTAKPEPFLGVPSNDIERSDILQTKPRGWQYLLFVGYVLQVKDEHELQWHDHEIGYAKRNGRRLEDEEALNYIAERMGDLSNFTEGMMPLFSDELQKVIFSEEVELRRIEHFARRIGEAYATLLYWAADIRGTVVPEKMKKLYELAAHIVDQPVKEFRNFMNDAKEVGDRIVDFNKNSKGEDLYLKSNLVLTIDDKAMGDFLRELKRQKRKIKWGF